MRLKTLAESGGAALVLPRLIFLWLQEMERRRAGDPAGMAVVGEAFEVLQAICSKLTGCRWVSEEETRPKEPGRTSAAAEEVSGA